MQETETIKGINKVVYLPNNDILPNRFQPRKYFDEEEIMQLSESIKEHGVINPVIVRKLGEKFELVAGERRYKANILAGNDSIPAIVMDVNDKESSEIAVVENIQRKDLNAIEEAISYKRILDIGYMTQDQLAQKMGKSQSSIANKIRLLKLSDEVQDALMKKQISERHARSLLKLESQKKQNELLDRIINERLTVRKTDEEIEKMNNNMNSFNNIYNNTPDSLTPIMPGSNVSDVNISGVQQSPQTQINSFVEPSIQKPIIDNTIQQPININDNSIINNSVSELSNMQDMPLGSVETSKVETIPTMSIDDVLAKANQPSVVGNQLHNQQADDSSVNEFQIPNYSPIKEETTPIIQKQNNNQVFGIPDLSPINESPSDAIVQPIDSMQNFSTPNINKDDELQSMNNVQQNFVISNLGNQTSVPDFLNSDYNSVSTNHKPLENNFVEQNEKLNTFAPFSLKNEDSSVDSPISTSPIIDVTQNSINDQSNGSDVDNSLTKSIQSQFEKVPEPIIVNEYNDQYDPIMPKQQNQQPTIDFKTIINLIRKCSQAIENSGYKIETEEYNLDNLYQVVFKINKQ